MARTKRRATGTAKAEQHAAELAGRLGAALRDARGRVGLKQVDAARRAGISQATWSSLEIDRDPRYTLGTWDRAAHAVGSTLSAFLPGATAAGMPRDAVHLRNQELVLRTAQAGGWRGVPEQGLDRELTRSRHGDVVLTRTRESSQPLEWCLVEVVDWTDDVGESVRDFDRRLGALDRLAVSRMHGDQLVPSASGMWLLRATLRNRRLVAEHRHFFRGRFPGSGRAWLAALISREATMPDEPALLWVDVRGTRIFAARFGE
jgi:transcriptional regulator with XRE-family HTH domain